MSRIQEIRIVALNGIDIPDGTTVGSTVTITATLLVSRIDQEWIDITTEIGKPQRLPGSVLVGTVAKEITVA